MPPFQINLSFGMTAPAFPRSPAPWFQVFSFNFFFHFFSFPPLPEQCMESAPQHCNDG